VGAGAARPANEPDAETLSWPRLLAHIAANTGWSIAHIRAEVDLPLLQALQAEWRLHPPVHHLVAAYLGYEPPVELKPDQSPPPELQSLLALTPQWGGGKVDDSAWHSAQLH
jgi:hypothetical protein